MPVLSLQNLFFGSVLPFTHNSARCLQTTYKDIHAQSIDESCLIEPVPGCNRPNIAGRPVPLTPERHRINGQLSFRMQRPDYPRHMEADLTLKREGASF